MTSQHIFNGSSHLFARGPRYFGGYVGKRRMELFSKGWCAGSKSEYLLRVGTVNLKISQRTRVFPIAVDMEVLCRAFDIGKLAQRDGVIDAVLGHVAISGPFAAGDSEQPRCVDVDDVIPRERRGLAVSFHERTQAYVNGQNVCTCWGADKETSRCIKDEFDLFLIRAGFQSW